MRRRQAQMSQALLADHLGIPLQQIGKYENGQSRITVGRLANIASILDVPVAYFFVGLSYPLDASVGRVWAGPKDRIDITALVAGYLEIPSPAVRREIVEMVRALAKYSNDVAKWH